MNDRKGAFLYIRKDNRCDQVAADDKKHIHKYRFLPKKIKISFDISMNQVYIKYEVIDL